jgi:DNA-binding transcriptional LysR family regulator
MDLLHQEKLDIAIVDVTSRDRSLHFRKLRQRDFYVAVPQGHPLSGQQELRASDLSPYPQIGFSHSMDKSFEDWANKDNSRQRFVCQVNTVHSALSLVQAGVGVTIVPAECAAPIKGIKYIPLLNERILLGVPKELTITERLQEYEISQEAIRNGDFDFSSAKKIDVSLFGSEEFILLKRGNKLRQLATRIFDECKIIPNVSMEFDRLNIATHYAEAGFGICFITDTSLRYGGKLDNLCVYLPNTEFSDLTMYVIHKKNKHLSSTVREFISHIQK